MAKKRFKILDTTIKKYLKAGGATGAPNIPANTPLAEYYSYLKEEKTITINRAEDSLPGQLLTVSVRPFAYDPADNEEYLVDLSKRANDEASIAALRTAANIITTPGDDAKVVKGFVPARCTISLPDTTKDAQNVTSAYTGIIYDKKGKRSYTFPFGSDNTGSRPATVKAEIRGALPATTKGTLNFRNEKI